jgi:excinuclease ABC subunit C
MGIRSQNLREKLAKLPDLPGVYLFKDKRGAVVYIGKASSLKSRVQSYFHSGWREPKTEALVNTIKGLDFIVTDSEVEALFLEAKLIREYKPKFNAALKDDKSYPVIAVTEEDFPRVLITRDRRLKAKYYGPFASAKELRLCACALQKIFKFRTCKVRIEAEQSRFRRPCLLYYVGRCTAPCAGKITREDYRASIRDFEKFLAGGKKHLIEEIRLQMEAASRNLEFERAAILRDRISAISSLGSGPPLQADATLWQRTLSCLPHHEYAVALRRLKRLLHLPRLPRIIEGIDAANISGCEAVGSAVVFVNGKAHKDSYRRYRIKFASPRDDPAMIGEIVQRRFRRKLEEKEKPPDILLVDGGKGQVGSAQEALKKFCARIGGAPAVVGLAKGNERIYLTDGSHIDLERTDPALKLLQFVRDEAHRFAQHYHHILRRKALKKEER